MLMLDIGIALIVAKLFGFVFEKFRQPPVVGEIITGMVLGKYFFDHIFDVYLGAGELYPFDFSSEVFTEFSHIGIIFLLFITGMEFRT